MAATQIDDGKLAAICLRDLDVRPAVQGGFNSTGNRFDSSYCRTLEIYVASISGFRFSPFHWDGTSGEGIRRIATLPSPLPKGEGKSLIHDLATVAIVRSVLHFKSEFAKDKRVNTAKSVLEVNDSRTLATS